MKVLYIVIAIPIALLFIFKNNMVIVAEQTLPAIHATAALNDTISFALQIQPILVNHCSPCHFRGGKMYDRLPFDQPGTIIHHESGLLRRISNEKDKDLIRDFISQQRK